MSPLLTAPASPTPSSPPSLSHSLLSSSSSSLCEERVNEHLAVLLPKHLWKPDADAAHCDNYYCRVPFNLFERRHHCRKCGGVYCSACTQRSTPLLDATNLDFLLPPRNVPISTYDSPISPVINSRVCDDCWDQLHGLRTTPHTPSRPLMKRALSHPFSTLQESMSRSSSPTQIKGPAFSRTLRHAPSHSSMRSGSTSSSSSSSRRRRTGVLRASQLQLPAELEKSYGELDAYPLRRSSVLCKATGGGRWEPKQSPVLDGYRPPVPGAKARFEIEMEKEEEEERRRRQNPIIIDGEFRYRFAQRQCPPPPIQTNSFSLSTF